jgi:hypothetical protein
MKTNSKKLFNMKILKLISVFLLLNVAFYLVGSFIAWELNPINCFLFSSAIGRVIFLMIEAGLVAISLELSDY